MDVYDDPDRLPLPNSWPRYARAAVLHAISLAASAFVLHLERWLNGLAPAPRDKAERERLEAEVAMLKEERYIKNAPMARIPPARPLPRQSSASTPMRPFRGFTTATSPT